RGHGASPSPGSLLLAARVQSQRFLLAPRLDPAPWLARRAPPEGRCEALASARARCLGATGPEASAGPALERETPFADMRPSTGPLVRDAWARGASKRPRARAKARGQTPFADVRRASIGRRAAAVDPASQRSHSSPTQASASTTGASVIWLRVA